MSKKYAQTAGYWLVVALAIAFALIMVSCQAKPADPTDILLKSPYELCVDKFNRQRRQVPGRYEVYPEGKTIHQYCIGRYPA